MTYRAAIKKLARGYMQIGDTPRQAIREACAFHATISKVLGQSIPKIHDLWGQRRDARMASGTYIPPL